MLGVGSSGRRGLLRDLGAQLSDHEWDVLELYFGWSGKPHMTQHEVGVEVGLSQPGVSNVYRQGAAKLRRAIAENARNAERLRAIRGLLPSAYLVLMELCEIAGVKIEAVAEEAARQVEVVKAS